MPAHHPLPITFAFCRAQLYLPKARMEFENRMLALSAEVLIILQGIKNTRLRSRHTSQIACDRR